MLKRRTASAGFFSQIWDNKNFLSKLQIKGNNGEEIFEAYAENNTPAAYRVFWHYGPKKDNITILTITTHP